MSGFSETFQIVQFFIPTVVFIIIIIFCTTLCKAFQRARQQRRLQRELAEVTTARADRPPVFIIPFAPSEEELRALPRYSTTQRYAPPPSYEELRIKPDFIPRDPPPSYSESITSPPSAEPAGIVPSQPPQTQL